MKQEFSVGEWVERIFDGKVGVVKRIQPGVGDAEGDYYFYVDLDPHRGADEDLWAGTTAAWRRHHRLHAHSSTSSRDCDGDYTSGHVYEMTLEERCYDSLHSLHGTLTVTEDGLEWYEQTEEGYRAASVRWCDDDCPDERSWQRDHRAESMGY
jgi:hypothetical protein